MKTANVKYEDVLKKMRERFVYCDDVVLALWMSYKAAQAGHRNQNVILCGPPGHAKSEMVEEFFNIMGEKDVVTQSCSVGTRESDITAPINVKEYMENGKTEIMFDQSILDHEYVVLEEGLDMPVKVFQSLKDIITSGKVRKGHKEYVIKTKMFVICTNMKREDVAKNDSIKAAFERFPITVEVVWKAYGSGNYDAMFAKIYKEMDQLTELSPLSSYLGEHAAKKGNTPLSPRTAVAMAKMYIDVLQNTDLHSLRLYDGVDSDLLKKTADQAIQLKQAKQDIAYFNITSARIRVLRDEITEINDFKYSEVGSPEQAKVEMLKHLEKLNTISKDIIDLKNDVTKMFDPATRKIAVKDTVTASKADALKLIAETFDIVNQIKTKLTNISGQI